MLSSELPPLQLGDNSMMQAVLKMGDGVSNTPRRPVPQELQHPHSKVRGQHARLCAQRTRTPGHS